MDLHWQLPHHKNRIQYKVAKKIQSIKGLCEKLKLFESMKRIFLNECGCELCNNKNRVKVRDCKKCSTCKRNSHATFKVYTNRLINKEKTSCFNTLDSYKGSLKCFVDQPLKHTSATKEYSYMNCFKVVVNAFKSEKNVAKIASTVTCVDKHSSLKTLMSSLMK